MAQKFAERAAEVDPVVLICVRLIAKFCTGGLRIAVGSSATKQIKEDIYSKHKQTQRTRDKNTL